MSKLKEKTAADYAKDIIKESEIWNYINENGCQDPFWADGVNMNLVRNHIVYAKNQILQLAEKGEEIPEEYYMPTPPEVADNYIVKKNKHYKERSKRLEEQGEQLTHKKTRYNGEQASLL